MTPSTSKADGPLLTGIVSQDIGKVVLDSNCEVSRDFRSDAILDDV